jgi:hypothetical protein
MREEGGAEPLVSAGLRCWMFPHKPQTICQVARWRRGRNTSVRSETEELILEVKNVPET